MGRYFPDNPNNNDYHQARGRRYKYNSSKNRWVNVTTNEEEIETLNTHTANPPTYEEDPSDVGAFWYDSDADVLYVCTDNTPGDNVWKGVTVTGHLVKLVVPWQGTNYGYATHGEYPNVSKNTIQSLPFASDTGTSSAGSLVYAKHYSAGVSDINSATGYAGAGYKYPGNSIIYQYEKFSMNSDGSASDAAVAGTANNGYTNQGMQDPNREYGYMFFGIHNSPAPANRINGQKFPFSAGGGDTALFGDADSSWLSSGVACGNADYGYVAGTGISKMPYASEDTCINVGSTTVNRSNSGGCSSSDYGYVVGGQSNHNTIDRFPFASDTNASDVGDLSIGRYTNATVSSTTYGYTMGGRRYPSNPNSGNTVEKFPFASLGNASSIGNLYQRTYNKAGGQQF
jgi:hypothetical protein